MGKGLREKILRTLGMGDLYNRLVALSSELSDQHALLVMLEREKNDLISSNKSYQSELLDLRDIAKNLQLEYSKLQQEHVHLHAQLTSQEEQLLQSDERFALGEEQAANLNAHLITNSERLEHFESLSSSHRLIELEYPVKPRVRHGWGKPDDPVLTKLIDAGNLRYAERIASFLPLVEKMSAIPGHSDELTQPHWINPWLPAFDAISIYAQLALRNPAKFLEIGSGTSTKFARRAISDFGLRTKIISIDPFPRSEIDEICDEVIRTPLQEVPSMAYGALTSEDMLFFDGSHRAFQDSDVTVFFTEILPALPAGLLVGIHDIFLPSDYPPSWIDRHYSEQYLLTCWLLAGDRLKVEFPVFYCTMQKELVKILEPLWRHPNLIDAAKQGGAFWFTKTAT